MSKELREKYPEGYPFQIDITLQYPRRGSSYADDVEYHWVELAYEEYENHYGSSQSLERLLERQGFSVLEMIGLLSDYVMRLKKK